jgi:2,3-bisphosphoglycerate-dependent phosphoglycerate mutase
MQSKIHNLYIVRHTESTWNKEDRFTGWEDVPLSQKGERDAFIIGEKMKENGQFPNIVFTSYLKRTIQTAFHLLDGNSRSWVNCQRRQYLIERHYGIFQGEKRNDMKEKYGVELFNKWRRGFNAKPPAIEKTLKYSYISEFKEIPKSEALADVYTRLVNNYYIELLPAVLNSKETLIVTHGNVMRAFFKLLRKLNDEEITKVEARQNTIYCFKINSFGEVVDASENKING